MRVHYEEGDEPLKAKEMIDLFRNHNIVTFTLIGVGETTIETSLFDEAIKELVELERKAKAYDDIMRIADEMVYLQNRMKEENPALQVKTNKMPTSKGYSG